MLVKNNCFCILFILVCYAINSVHTNDCKKKKQKEMSRTKCVAGRRFFARFDQMPLFSKVLSQHSLVQPYVYPWIAEISALYAGRKITCTGTLINDRYVITAQHCVLPPLEPQHLWVSLGIQGMYEPRQSLEPTPPTYLQSQVLQIILHPFYDYTNVQTASNDLALLKINPVAYSRTIYPIQLPTVVDKYFDLTNLKAENAGWQNPVIGRSNLGQSFSKKFHKMAVQIIGTEDCSNFNVYYKRAITPELLCTSSTENFRNEPCNGDTGAPLMIENNKRVYNVTVLVGIVSWSAPKNKPCIWYGSPVVYVRIDKKLQWIIDNTQDAQYCRY